MEKIVDIPGKAGASGVPAGQALRLRGAPNFRDMGGHPGADGRRVRHGRLFRSDGLERLTLEDLEIVRGLRIGVVCDLRSDHERQIHPNRWPLGAVSEVLLLDIMNDLRASDTTLRRLLVDDPNEHGARQLMFHTYRMMPRAFVGRLRTLVDRLLAGDAPALLIHCTAGKDRTGFLAALLLLALGVPLESVYEDYLLTAVYSDIDQLAAATARVIAPMIGREPEPAMVRALTEVRRDYLDAAFAALAQEFGSIDAYLALAGGLDQERRGELRRLLLE